MFRKYYIHVFLIVLGVVLYFFANFQRVAVPGAVFSLLQQKLSVSAPYITSLGAVFMYTYAISQIFMGRMVERYGGLRVIAIGGAAFSLGSILFPNTHSMPLLYLSRVLLGLGAGCFYLSLVKELERCSSDKNFGLILAIAVNIGYSGCFFANAPFVWSIDKYGFTETLNFIGIITLIASLIFIIVGSRYKLTIIKTDRRIEWAPYREVLFNRYNVYLFIFGSLNYALMYVLQTVVGKKFLEDFCMLSSNKAAWVLSIMSIISALSSMGLAFLSRLFGGRKVIFFKLASIVSVISFTLVIISLIFNLPHTAMTSVIFFCLAIVASMSPLLVMFINEVNSHKICVTATGIMNTLFFLAVGFFGNVTGFMMNLFPAIRNIEGILIYGRNSYLAVFIPLLLFSLVELFFAFRLKEPRAIN